MKGIIIRWIPGIVLLMIAVMVLVLNFMPQPPMRGIPHSETEIQQLTIKFARELVILDRNGNPVTPVEYDSKDPIGDFFRRDKEKKVEITRGIPAFVISFKASHCDALWLGNYCYAEDPS